MKNNLESISQYYKVPAKRGVRVRCNGREGKITAHSTHGQYINVRYDNATASVAIHPFDLDYFVDGAWQMGSEYQKRFDARIDAWNLELAKTPEEKPPEAELRQQALWNDFYGKTEDTPRMKKELPRCTGASYIVRVDKKCFSTPRLKIEYTIVAYEIFEGGGKLPYTEAQLVAYTYRKLREQNRWLEKWRQENPWTPNKS